MNKIETFKLIALSSKDPEIANTVDHFDADTSEEAWKEMALKSISHMIKHVKPFNDKPSKKGRVNTSQGPRTISSWDFDDFKRAVDKDYKDDAKVYNPVDGDIV